MKIRRTLSRTALGLFVLSAAFAELFTKRPPGPPSVEAKAAAPRSVPKIVLLTCLACVLVLLLGGLLLMASGVYEIAADRPHIEPVRWALLTGRTRSVEFHSRGIRAPDLSNPKFARDGFVLYRKLCQPCHGAPGVPNEQIGRGINPKPPPLMTTGANWTDPQLFWIITHGLKLSGMPGFAPPLSNADRWALVAFVRQMAVLAPADYQALIASDGQPAQSAAQPTAGDLGFGLLHNAHPEAGKALIQKYGCASCHQIPAIGRGLVGPPLAGFAERQYIAGSFVNAPANLVAFIMDPPKMKPHTAMPNLGVRRPEAVDMAAYLYTLGDPKRLADLQRAAGMLSANRQARLSQIK